MKRIFFLTLVFAIAVTQSAFAAKQMRIAIMELKADGVPAREARTVSNMIRTDLINMNKFVVLERAQMNEILKEQGFQQTGCTDASCAVEIGRLLSAKKILVGEVSPMGKTIIITVRIVDVEKGVSEYAAREKAQSEDVLDLSVARITRKLASVIERKSVGSYAHSDSSDRGTAGPVTPAGYYARGILPGWSQIYTGHRAKGWILMGAFVGSAAFATVATMGTINDMNTYQDLGSDAADSEFDDAYDNWQKSAGLAAIAIGITSAIYLYNWADVLFFNKPAFTAASGATEPGDTFLALDTRLPDRVYRSDRGLDLKIGLRF